MCDIISVDDSNFEEEVLQSKLPALVYWSAIWCAVCVRQQLILEKFATKVKVCIVSVDNSPIIASNFNIKSVPNIMLFNNGIKIASKVGLQSAALLESIILEHLG